MHESGEVRTSKGKVRDATNQKTNVCRDLAWGAEARGMSGGAGEGILAAASLVRS